MLYPQYGPHKLLPERFFSSKKRRCHSCLLSRKIFETIANRTLSFDQGCAWTVWSRQPLFDRSEETPVVLVLINHVAICLLEDNIKEVFVRCDSIFFSYTKKHLGDVKLTALDSRRTSKSPSEAIFSKVCIIAHGHEDVVGFSSYLEQEADLICKQIELSKLPLINAVHISPWVYDFNHSREGLDTLPHCKLIDLMSSNEQLLLWHLGVVTSCPNNLWDRNVLSIVAFLVSPGVNPSEDHRAGLSFAIISHVMRWKVWL